MLLETKSLLAKLMATENLHIEQRKVDTASFNTKTRVLTVPILDKDVPAYTYDLFMGHEVGHALWTPYEGWVQAQIKDKINKDILNIVEDSRIERKIKYKYPGIRNSFVKAYNELFGDNFFGTDGKNLDKLNFIDRVNLHQKVGAGLNIQFNEKERELISEVESTEKFSDVIRVTKLIQKYLEDKVKEELQPQPKKQKVKVIVKDGEPEEGEQMEIPEGIDPEADTEFEFEFEQKDKTEDSKDEPEEGEGESDNSGEDEPSGEDTDESAGGTGEAEEPETEETPEEDDGQGQSPSKFEQQLQEALEKELRSFTDEAYKQNEKTLYADGPGTYTYVDIPKMDTDKCIFDYKELYARYKQECDKRNLTEFNRIRTESNKVVSYLVKEFEMRKNADQSKRATISKTGELNMGKIFSYKFSEDIFKKISVVPGGKSHGLVMFLDWSGSMHNHLENTVKQLISLVLFCKKVNIPYEVYAFSDGTISEHTGRQIGEKVNQMVLGKLSLLNFLSSRMSAADFTYACSVLVHLAQSHHTVNWLNMSSTPLNETILAAMDIVPQFQKKYRLQVVNTVFLTDGDSNGGRSYYYDESYYSRTMNIDCRKDCVVIMRDPLTKNEVKFTMDGRNYGTAFTNAYIKLLKLRTNCNIVGFYVISGREFSSYGERWFTKGTFEQAKEQLRKDRYAILTDSGFDEYYFLRSNGLNTDEEDFEVAEGVTQRGLVSAFTKYAGNKIANRVVLNRFIGMIA